MASSSSLAHHFTGCLGCPPATKAPSLAGFLRSPQTKKSRSSFAVVGVVTLGGTFPLTKLQKDRHALKRMFEDAYDRCHNNPLDGVEFSFEDFDSAVSERELDFKVGDVVRGTVFLTDKRGAAVDVGTKSCAFLPLEEACPYEIRHVIEAGVFPGLEDDFVVIGKDRDQDSYIVSWTDTQIGVAWERCRQLQAEDTIVTGQVVGGNRGGVTVIVECIQGFVPFSQISAQSTSEDLADRILPLKFVEVDEEQGRLVLSNRKAMADSQAQLGIGSVVVGTVQSLKPYGAFIDIGGINGLLHVSQISHDRVADISTVLQPGDTLKVMILSHDRERGRVSLSTKKLEPTPGDMIRDPTLVFEKADEMAQIFRQRIAQAEAMARADMLRFQPESGLTLSSEGVLGPLSSDLGSGGLDLVGSPPAEE